MTTGTLRALRSLPMAAVVMPLPTELTTPPVMKMYLAVMYPQSQGASSPTKDDNGSRFWMEGAGGRGKNLDSRLGTQDLGWRGTRYEVRGTRCEVRGTRCEVRGARYEVRGTRCEVRGARYEVRGVGYEVRGTRGEVRGADGKGESL